MEQEQQNYRRLIKNLRLISEGNSTKAFGKPIGYKVCPEWLHKKYREAVSFICQRCMQEEKECGKLIPHRTTRKTKGGLYTLVPLNHPHNNVKVVCFDCHKLFHANDSRVVKWN